MKFGSFINKNFSSRLFSISSSNAVVDDSAHQVSFLERWFFSTDHKDIGTLYFILGAFSGVIGTMLSVFMRIELSYPGVQILAENHQLYNVWLQLTPLLWFFLWLCLLWSVVLVTDLFLLC